MATEVLDIHPPVGPEGVPMLRQWAPCVAMLMLSLLSYIDRSVLANLSPMILNDLHMNATQYTLAVSVFSICYMVANPVWGFWMDRHGLFVTVMGAVFLWSLASGSHALMTGLTGMCLARGALGFGEGATFPAGLSTVVETLPDEQRSFGLGLAYSGGSLGAVITPLLITPVALHYGWRAAFEITGLLGLLWIGFWVMLRAVGLYKLHPYHVAHKAKHARPVAEGRHYVRWNPRLFASVSVYGLGAAPLAFGLYAAPLYLSHVLHVPQARLGHLLWLPPAGWEAGYLFWGWLADKRHHKHVQRPFSVFCGLSVAGMIVTLLPLAARSAWPVAMTMALFFAEMFIAGGFVVISLTEGTYAQEKRNPGFLSGIAISGWALVTGLMLPVLGKLFDRGEYTAAFWVVGLLPPLGTVIWRVLSGRTRSRVMAA